jgi:hypothetical protein
MRASQQLTYRRELVDEIRYHNRIDRPQNTQLIQQHFCFGAKIVKRLRRRIFSRVGQAPAGPFVTELNCSP